VVRVALLSLLIVGLMPAAAGAQAATVGAVAGPGPYVIDIRGTTLRVPQTANFYPAVPGATVIPARSFGIEAGAHVYPIDVGERRRIGFGVDLSLARGTASTAPVTTENVDGTTTVETFPDVAVTMRIIAPQVSMNFGTTRGWSYLSGGAGPARVEATAGSLTKVTSKVSANAGAGARWFIADHVAVGFDLRAHWLGSRALFAASAGFSLK
jgi:hypothetical protein